jgi:hypothetical protein
MKTREEVIAELKAENPTLRTGSDEEGYVDLTSAEYEATIAGWADNLLADEAKAAEIAAKVVAKQALLAKLGITEEEAALLLGGTN